jgi:Trk K+ transport system NAD-binding subunit
MASAAANSANNHPGRSRDMDQTLATNQSLRSAHHIRDYSVAQTPYRFPMLGHIIVCGDDALALRIIDELNDAEMTVVQLHSPTGLEAAGISSAAAVICASADDAVNLEVALLARQANPIVRVVARLSNSVLRAALADSNGPGAVLDVADLAAPSVVEALLGRTTHTITVSNTTFVVSGDTASRGGTFRELYGHLAPVAVLRGGKAPNPGEVIACPNRDIEVYEGDWTTMIGTSPELAAEGVPASAPIVATVKDRSVPVRMADSVRALHHDINPMFYRALAVAATLLIVSTVVLRYFYRHEDEFTWVDALYFTAATISTTGYGDFNFSDQPTWLRLWGVMMMLVGWAASAFVIGFATDVLLSRRLMKSAGLQKASHLHRHFVIVGLGSFGTRVADMLRAAGQGVVVIERNEDNRYLSGARELGIPVIFGDATMRDTLEAAQIRRARAFAVLTEDDMTNIETAIVAREMLGPDQTEHHRRVPIVMRIYDRALGRAVGQRLGFNFVRSTVDLATPWFMGAAMGLQVLGTFSVGQRSFMIGGGEVEPGSELDGMRLLDLSTQTRVIAIRHPSTGLGLHPEPGYRLAAGDTIYLVGPFRELLATLRTGQRTTRSGKSHYRTR